MPKQTFIKKQVAQEGYKRCADCPICGLIPESERINETKHLCTLTRRAIPDIEAKPYCIDLWWSEYVREMNGTYLYPVEAYNKYRLPFEMEHKQST